MLRHAGVLDAQPFSESAMERTKGFVGVHHDEPDISHLLPRLRQAFAQPQAELHALLDTFWPEMGFEGVPAEL